MTKYFTKGFDKIILVSDDWSDLKLVLMFPEMQLKKSGGQYRQGNYRFAYICSVKSLS